MSQRPREFNIESLKTPKGDVPTVKGLETLIELIFSENHKIDQNFTILNQKIEDFSAMISHQTKQISDLAKNFSDLVVILGGLERKFEQQQSASTNNRFIETIDLLTLKKDISQILNKIESLFVVNER